MRYSKQTHLLGKIFLPGQTDALNKRLHYWRFKDLRIAFTNGCFDILHAGHTDYLARAADLADVLLVGLNTDDSVRRLKGANRPLNDQSARAKVLAALSFVDAVVLFDEDTPEQLIRQVNPLVLVKGADYRPDDIAGADHVTRNGGHVTTLPLLEGYSTSALISKVRDI